MSTVPRSHLRECAQVKLTQTLMKLFIEYQISPDQLSVDAVSWARGGVALVVCTRIGLSSTLSGRVEA